MPTITVKSQDELTRVLANATSDTAVEMGPDAQGRGQDYDIVAPTSVILKVAKGATLTAHVPDLTVDVNGGIFDGNNKPHHVFVMSGSATAGRGSRVTALGGTFRERGGATDAKTSAHIDNDAQAHISSGVVNVHNKARLMADGNAEVYAFDDAKVDAFGVAKVRADDNVELRAHDRSEAHLHGNSTGYGSGPVTLTMVSPKANAQVGSSARLRVGEGVHHDRFIASADVEPEFISAAEAKLPDTLNRIRSRGKNAYHRNASAAPIMDEEVTKFLEGREPGDPLNIAVMEAFQEGYRSQADAAASRVTPEKHLVYTDASGEHHYQPVSDIPYSGTLIDPDTGDDMDVSGWAESYQGDIRTDPMGIVYADAEGNRHTQPWGDVVQSGGLIDSEGEDMSVIGGTAEGDAPLFPEYIGKPSLEDAIAQLASGNNTACGKCHHPVEECMCFSGPSFPVTEKVAVVPTYADSTVVEDENLVKVGHKNGEPHTVQSFDWQRGRWGRSMIVAGGPGKQLLTKMESTSPDARKVPPAVAAAYGHATGKCLMCSKPLSDTASLSRGYGRSCANKLG